MSLCVGASGIGIGIGTADASAHRTLSRQQTHRIITVTGYHGLSSHHFRVAGAFGAASSRVVVVRLDGARLGVPLAGVRRDIRQAERLAAGGRSFTTRLKTGRGPEQRITYDVSPSGASEPHKSYVRYLIFTPHSERLGALTRPQRVPAIQALTVVSGSDRLNVTLLRDGGRGATWGSTRLPASPLYAMVESLNTTNRVTVSPATLHRLATHHVDLSYMTDPNHPHPTRRQELTNLGGRGFEIWSNSMAFAILSARMGMRYRHYAAQATHMRFRFYRRNEMRYLKVSGRQFHLFA